MEKRPRSERARLLAWYRAAARPLPWRGTRDPWAIWVSEVMLQQTRAETVEAYYARFLARFPTPRALAEADLDAVLALWSGLGYYRRARQLHAAAQVVVARHDGRVPHERAAREALPGVGRYTAGALGSIAFDLPEPVVDGNVARVLSRLRGIEAPRGSRASEAALWAEADALVRGPEPGALNQALMELGAVVCTPRSPRCGACPLRAGCRARLEGRAGVLPVARASPVKARLELVAVVARDARGRAWLVRSAAALYGGLFGPPIAPGRSRAAARAALDAAGLPGVVSARLGRLEHVLTHRVLDVVVYGAHVAGRPSRDRIALAAGAVAGVAPVGLSRLTQRVLALAPAGPPPRRARPRPSPPSAATPAKGLRRVARRAFERGLPPRPRRR